MRKSYTLAFKRQAVELADSIGNITLAAKQLGISDVNIHAWKDKFNEDILQSNSSQLSPIEFEELKKLRNENKELKKVNHILKSAAAFFSQDHLK